MADSAPAHRTLKIRELLRPHWKTLAAGLLAVIGGGVANLLEPWPLKIVFDNVLKSRQIHGWLNPLILSLVGDDKLRILKFAAVAALVIAAVGEIGRASCRERV